MAKPRALSKDKEQSSLVEALKFISLAQKKEGTPYQTHCVLFRNWAIGYDGTLTLATTIQEDLSACPHTELFLNAIAKHGSNFSLIQSSETSLTVKAGRLEAPIPCVPLSIIPASAPDDRIAPLGDALREGLGAVAFVAAEGVLRSSVPSIFVRGQSCFATDTRVMVEYWHGQDLPPMMLPKVAALTLAKIEKKLVGFGWTKDVSATFYFEDNSWMKTQLVTDTPYPFERILNQKTNERDVPTSFFEGVKAIAPFNELGQVMLCGDKIKSHVEEGQGASFEVSGLPNRRCYNAKALLSIEHLTKQIDLVGNNDIGYFFGTNVRGAIVQHFVPKPVDPAVQEALIKRMAELKAKRDAEPWKPPRYEVKGSEDEIPF